MSRRDLRRSPVEDIPLGSFTHRDPRSQSCCRVCASHRVTRIALCLTDGTPVTFLSCQACEARTWEDVDGLPMGIDEVLDRSGPAGRPGPVPPAGR